MTDTKYTKINLAAGDVFSEAACDALDNQIDELSRRFWRVDDQTWVTQNAVYTGTVWNREDIAKPAAAIRVDGSGNQIDILTADAGANPITWADGTLNAGAVVGTTVSGNLSAVKFTGTAGDTTTLKTSDPITGSSLGAGSTTDVATFTMPAGLQTSTLRFKITGSDEAPNGYSAGMWGIRVLVDDVQASDSTSNPVADVSVAGGNVVKIQVHVGGTGINTYTIYGYLKTGALTAYTEIVTPVW